MADTLDLVIVGAGISGLQGLRECLAKGLRVVALEKDAVPGGKWSGHGIYDCVQIQQHREDFFMPGMPWPEGTPDFATRDDMLSVTGRYILEYGLSPHIRCRSAVVSAAFDEATCLWTTTTASGVVWKSRFIAWAVGTLGTPNVPRQVKDALAGFGGEVVHSHEYYRPLPYSGQHVVVLGYGASSVEIAQDLARNGMCASVTLVAPSKVQADGSRSGQDWCLSRVLSGDGSRFCSQGQDGKGSSLEERNAMVREAMASRHPKYPACMPPELRPSGELEGKPAYPGMDGRPLGGRVIVSEGFLDCVSDGQITCVPGYLGRADATHVTVVYEGKPDVTLRADAVVVCTGYASPTQRIAPVMRPEPRDCDTLYKGLWMPDAPNAALIGHVFGFVSVPPFAGMQAKYLARVVSGAETLPSLEAMREWVSAVVDRFQVTQRLTENDYFRELRVAALGDDAQPVGAGPPEKDTDEGATQRGPIDDLIATAAGEALTFLDESRACAVSGRAGDETGGAIGLLAIGCESLSVVEALEAALRPKERESVRRSSVAAVQGPWTTVADHSMDLVLCQNALNDAVVDAGFVEEVLRVLKPRGHAVFTLMEGSDAAASWHQLFDKFEQPDAASGRHRWRLVHKTAAKALERGGQARCFVFRSPLPYHLPPCPHVSPPPSPPTSPSSASRALHYSPPSTQASSPPSVPSSTKGADDDAHQLFAYTSDFYVSMQSALEKNVGTILNRLRDEASESEAVCRTGVDADVTMARFDASGVIPEVGLLPVHDGEDGKYDATTGDAVGRKLAEAYLSKLEVDVLSDELRLQSGNMIGHMVRATSTRIFLLRDMMKYALSDSGN